MGHTSQLPEYWIHNRMDPPFQILMSHNIPSQLRPTLQQAIIDQREIGWSAAFQGFLSHHLLIAQQWSHPRSTFQGLQSTSHTGYLENNNSSMGQAERDPSCSFAHNKNHL